ncbi:MAG: hypothetical protein KBT35_01280 [Firmicutes bacterium]|nr:hypothetical protein [Candidatus Colivicinus equi]
MKVILIILTSTLISGLALGAFLLGYMFGSKKKEDNSLVIDNNNKEAVKSILDFFNYGVDNGKH